MMHKPRHLMPRRWQFQTAAVACLAATMLGLSLLLVPALDGVPTSRLAIGKGVVAKAGTPALTPSAAAPSTRTPTTTASPTPTATASPTPTATADPRVSYSSTQATFTLNGFKESTVTTEVATWRSRDGCTTAPTAASAGSLTTQVWGCAAGTRVELATYAGGSHAWPAGSTGT